jgi:hypothetical protein
VRREGGQRVLGVLDDLRLCVGPWPEEQVDRLRAHAGVGDVERGDLERVGGQHGLEQHHVGADVGESRLAWRRAPVEPQGSGIGSR